MFEIYWVKYNILYIYMKCFGFQKYIVQINSDPSITNTMGWCKEKRSRSNSHVEDGLYTIFSKSKGTKNLYPRFFLYTFCTLYSLMNSWWLTLQLLATNWSKKGENYLYFRSAEKLVYLKQHTWQMNEDQVNIFWF